MRAASDPPANGQQHNGDKPHDLISAAVNANGRSSTPVRVKGDDGIEYELDHGAVVIAAITSCTNTSNPSVLVAAGLVARKARALEA